MTAENHMLFKMPKKIHLPEALPESFYRKYFKALGPGGTLYVCVIAPNGTTPRVYLEKSKEETTSGIVRIFFRKEDAETYLDMVASAERCSPELIRYWETAFDDLIPLLMKVDKNSRAKGRAGVRSVVNVFHQYRMVDVDIFWTKEPHLMV